jgi:hypothetical protein
MTLPYLAGRFSAAVCCGFFVWCAISLRPIFCQRALAVATPLSPPALLGRYACGSTLIRHSSTASKAPCANPGPADATLPRITSATDGDAGVQLQFADGRSHLFHKTWLRHNCTSDRFVEKSSGQIMFPLKDLELHNPISSLAITDDGRALQVVWAKDGHISSYDLDVLVEQTEVRPSSTHRMSPATKIPRLKFDYVMADDEGLWRWLDHLSKDGICMITRTPLVENMVKLLAYRVSHPMPTIYGEVFDVKCTSTPINMAYTSLPLELHQDLIYYESAPGLQILHCLRFDEGVQGGESALLDGFAAAERLRQLDPQSFNALVEIPAYFEKIHYERDLPVHLLTRRPHIMLNEEKEIINLAWAPPFHSRSSEFLSRIAAGEEIKDVQISVDADGNFEYMIA